MFLHLFFFFFSQGVGDLKLAEQSLRLCLSVDANHGHAYNNLAIILFNRGDTKQAMSYLLAAQASSPFLFEPFYNQSMITFQVLN